MSKFDLTYLSRISDAGWIWHLFLSFEGRERLSRLHWAITLSLS
jgi:hypothetical protein